VSLLSKTKPRNLTQRSLNGQRDRTSFNEGGVHSSCLNLESSRSSHLLIHPNGHRSFFAQRPAYRSNYALQVRKYRLPDVPSVRECPQTLQDVKPWCTIEDRPCAMSIKKQHNNTADNDAKAHRTFPSKCRIDISTLFSVVYFLYQKVRPAKQTLSASRHEL
jgi:hypothetical protein